MPSNRILIAAFLSACLASPASATFLSRQGNKLFDAEGKEVRLTGVNWFGFETSNLAPHGLWTRDWLGVLMQVKEMGFNSIRIPYCDRMLEPDATTKSISPFGNDPYRGGGTAINQEIIGKTPLEVLDIIIGGCRQLGLKVILDNHSRNPDGYIEEKVWTTASVPEEKWIANWVMLAKRYKGNNTVVAFDLDNEPHGTLAEGGAEWGTGTPRDWRVAAQKCGNAILAENPDVLIIVEGVQVAGGENYWWGGNLIAAKTAPVVLTKPEKLVYSPHEYGPEVHAQKWFTDAAFPGNLPGIWDKFFGYLHKGGDSHLLVGEFGIRDAASAQGKAGVWFDEFLKYMGKDYSWTFWCLNPNSGDTGGLLASDWLTVEKWKLDKLKPYMAPPIGRPETSIRKIRRGALPPAASAGQAADANGRLRPAGRLQVPLFPTP